MDRLSFATERHVNVLIVGHRKAQPAPSRVGRLLFAAARALTDLASLCNKTL